MCKGLIGFTSARFLRCAIRAPSLQTVALKKWSVDIGTVFKPTSVVERRFCATDRKCTRTGRSSRQALLSGDTEVTACERVIGQVDSVNISCSVASVQLKKSVLVLLNTMRTLERHTEVSCIRGITWRFGRGCHVVHVVSRSSPTYSDLSTCNVFLVGVGFSPGSSILWQYILMMSADCACHTEVGRLQSGGCFVSKCEWRGAPYR